MMKFEQSKHFGIAASSHKSLLLAKTAGWGWQRRAGIKFTVTAPASPRGAPAPPLRPAALLRDGPGRMNFLGGDAIAYSKGC